MRLVLSAQRVSTLLFCKLLCALLATSGCSSPTGGTGASVGNTETGEAGAANTDHEPVPESLTFTPSPSKPLMLSPKETRELTVVADPAGSFLVRFALVGSSAGSGPGDAILNAGDVQTGD